MHKTDYKVCNTWYMRYILQVLVIAWCRVQYDSEIKQNIINKENICYVAKG